MKHKKRLYILVVIVIVSIIVIVGYMRKSDDTQIISRINDTWNIGIPTDAHILYDTDNLGGFPMDGCTYIVCEYADSSEVKELFDEENAALNNLDEVRAFYDCLDVDIPEKYRLSEEKQYLNIEFAKKDDKLSLYYDSVADTLYIAESLI